MAGLLEGVRVIDLTHYLAGPYCTKLLATLGADMVKIERPGTGDPLRHVGPFPAALSPAPLAEGKEGPQTVGSTESGAWFLYLNTSKSGLPRSN